MRILYAIQGTGNGHITRSVSIINELQKKAEVDILVSGIHNEIKLPLPVAYQFQGLGFVFGKQGGIDYLKTYKRNNIKTLLKEIKSLPVERYNFVISDFEPVSVWAASKARIPTIGISNQASFMHPHIKKPWPITISGLFLENYVQCDYNIGLHYESIDQYIETPVIRDEIRHGMVSDSGHGLVYLPSYSDEMIFNTLKKVSHLKWMVFSKHTNGAYQKENISFEPINGALFTEKLLSCHLLISAAGFGSTSEALFLGKKLIVVPMKNQYEQKFNAYTLEKLGVSTLKSLKSCDASTLIEEVIQKNNSLKINYPDNAGTIADKAIALYNGPILQGILSNSDKRDKPLEYYLNPPKITRDQSGTLSF